MVALGVSSSGYWKPCGAVYLLVDLRSLLCLGFSLLITNSLSVSPVLVGSGTILMIFNMIIPIAIGDLSNSNNASPTKFQEVKSSILNPTNANAGRTMEAINLTINCGLRNLIFKLIPPTSCNLLFAISFKVYSVNTTPTHMLLKYINNIILLQS